MAVVVPRTDPRFAIASRTRNSRFPSSEAQLAGRVAYCLDAEDVARTLQQTLDAGLRPTIRSSGHCYEDFIVNNPNGTILDVSALNHVGSALNGSGPYTLGPGTMLGRGYEQLFKLANVCIPAGNCYTVTSGGHISGGGYGTLARMYGLTVDWLTAVDIVTVDRHGKAVPRHVSKSSDPDLFRALRGGQGSNFGIITAFHFDRLPSMPQDTVRASISWDWKDMTEEKFVGIMRAYGEWMERNSPKKETAGLFGALYLNNPTSGRVRVGAEIASESGPVQNLSVLFDLLDKFQVYQPSSTQPELTKPVNDQNGPGSRRNTLPGVPSRYDGLPVMRQSWLEATIQNQGGSTIVPANNHRAKYKSCYMNANFSEEEARAYYRMMTGDKTRGLIVAIDAYGGAVNAPERLQDTAVSQRSAVMKIQYQSYWQSPDEDAYRLAGIRDTYTAVYSVSDVPDQYKGTPYGCARYGGCYINYPDVDMLQYKHWPQLYYGDMYPFLQGVKRTYDPHNIFHHAMAIQA